MDNKLCIGILGTGSWGGTLAWLLSKKKLKIILWTPSKSEFEYIKKTKTLPRPKKIKINKNIQLTTNLNDVVKFCNLIIIAVPTNFFKDTILKLKKLKLNKKTILLSATKGITIKDNLRPSEIIKKYLSFCSYGVLSGPNIALDVISDAPIISVIASNKIKLASKLQELISSKNFRVYLNKDIDGVEIAGALKNVIAIASGMSDGFGFNISTKAALISRGLNEIGKIAIKEGAKAKTLLGAAGIGDLIATCCSKNSRNYKVGYMLAKGKKLENTLKDLGQVAEGTETVKAMVKLAKKHKVEIPIANAVYEVVVLGKNPRTVLNKLLKRPQGKFEIEY